MRRSAWIVALVSLLLLSACDRPTKPSPSKKSPSPQISSSDKVSVKPSPTPSETAEEREARERRTLGYTPEEPPPSGFVPSSNQSPSPGSLTLEVRLVPTCVEQGKLMKLTARTNRPKIQVSFISTMNDGTGHATKNDGVTDKNGIWNWQILIPVDSPPETHEILGAALDDEKEGDGNSVMGNWFFVVAKPGQCP